MDQRKVLLTAEEASLHFFQGKRSPWSLLQDVKKKRLPAIHLGNRIFFEVHSLNNYIEQQLQKSLSSEVIDIDGIRKID
jgi:hypothetical protein